MEDDHSTEWDVALNTVNQLSSLHDADTVEETVEAAAKLASSGLGCACAAILLGDKPDRLDLVAAADHRITKVINSSVEAGEGPTYDAFASCTAVVVNDLRTEARWPLWRPQSDDSGLASLLALRLIIGDRPAGVLLAADHTCDAFTEDEVAIAHIVVQHASIAVATCRQQATLAEAVDARKLVGQAMGILMERYDIGADQAFAILRRYSQDTNTKLRTVAVHLIRTRTLPGDPAHDDGVKV